jgi:hypothetical protein
MQRLARGYQAAFKRRICYTHISVEKSNFLGHPQIGSENESANSHHGRMNTPFVIRRPSLLFSCEQLLAGRKFLHRHCTRIRRTCKRRLETLQCVVLAHCPVQEPERDSLSQFLQWLYANGATDGDHTRAHLSLYEAEGGSADRGVCLNGTEVCSCHTRGFTAQLDLPYCC